LGCVKIALHGDFLWISAAAPEYETSAPPQASRGCARTGRFDALRIAEQNPHLFNKDVKRVVNAIFDEIGAALAEAIE
jgi:hypothetical protein